MKLIKPKLDYGVEIYSAASPAVLERISPMQRAAIRVATGAFRSSPVLSLYTESGLKSLSTNWGIKALNTYLRILASPTHPKHDETVLVNWRDEDGVQQNGGFLERMHYLCTLSETPTENIMPEIMSRCSPWQINNTSCCDSEPSRTLSVNLMLQCDFLSTVPGGWKSSVILFPI